jgi:hypothetical protein
LSDSYYKSSDQILVVNRSVNLNDWSSRRYIYIFDFEFRTMTVVTDYASGREASETHPFPALDAGMLRRMHDKLVELGGHPAPLETDDDPRRAFVIPQPLKPAGKGFKP